jgi:hypothetical protein
VTRPVSLLRPCRPQLSAGRHDAGD